MIADWDWLRRQYRERADPDDPPMEDKSKFQTDAFTRWNDSYTFNSSVGALFVAVRASLPAGHADSIEEFLVTFCPALAAESRFDPPRDPDVWDGEVHYATVPPEEVRRRLELLDGTDLPTFFAHCAEHLQAYRDDVLAAQREVVEFFFMWAATLGQAGSKGWGLVVNLG